MQVKNQNNEEFAKTITHESIQLIDVRTIEEYSELHIPGSKNIDVTNHLFASRVEELDKTKPVAVYCRSGQRSSMAAEYLASKGFEVYNLSTGMMSWNGARTR